MRYETPQDRARQRKLGMMVCAYLNSVMRGAFKLIETRYADALPFDYIISHTLDDGHVMSWIGEAKCRRPPYDEAFFWKNGWLVERERIASLMEATKGIPRQRLFFALLTADDAGYIVSVKRLLVGIRILREATDGMMKDDHGRIKADKSGLIVPMELMTRMEVPDEF